MNSTVVMKFGGTSVAITPAGDAVAAWIANTDGSGGGQTAAASHHAD